MTDLTLFLAIVFGGIALAGMVVFAYSIFEVGFHTKNVHRINAGLDPLSHGPWAKKICDRMNGKRSSS